MIKAPNKQDVERIFDLRPGPSAHKGHAMVFMWRAGRPSGPSSWFNWVDERFGTSEPRGPNGYGMCYASHVTGNECSMYASVAWVTEDGLSRIIPIIEELVDRYEVVRYE